MANEHIKMAAANLQRAAQDVREEQTRAKNEIENVKRQNASKISTLNNQVNQLQRSMHDPSVEKTQQARIMLEQQNLKTEISKIEADTKAYEINEQQRLNGMNGQINDLENLASNLNSRA